MKSKNIWLLVCLWLPLCTLNAQTAERWQQRAEYEIRIDFDVETHRFEGTQQLTYYNNSPDDLNRVFYHLYFNAFQPNSMMDLKSRTVKDPDIRVADRIQQLGPEEIGYHRIRSLKMDGKACDYEVVGTILEVALPQPIGSGEKAVFEMEFSSQVPVQVRRSGRDNSEGIAYSMSQWYPKMAEYDYQGWHANPYVGREFHGVWGEFDVYITIDKDYVIGATGYLQNPKAIGHGYAPDSEVNRPEGDRLTWHFKAPRVHDFVWGADPDYTHTMYEAQDGPTMHFFYQKNEKTEENWAMLPKAMDRAFFYINKNYGKYPYEQYSFIQGGDGGMEYPMATLITGHRSFPSLVGVSVHELMHSWFQGVLATNESLYPWMDEGFTSYATADVMNYLRKQGLVLGNYVENPQNYAGYFALVNSGLEQPLNTHADHYPTNFAYWRGAYDKGKVFLSQLRYVVGQQAWQKGMLEYYETWQFRHPNDNDFIRVMEKVSGLELDWYREYFVNTTATIDYGVQAVRDTMGRKTLIRLEKAGRMPMPLDVVVTYRDGSTELFTIPLRIMRGAKSQELPDHAFTVAEDWPWTHPTYDLILNIRPENIQSVEIDPSGRLADINPENNRFERE